MSKSFRDARGVEIRPGKLVGVAERSGNVAVVRVAVVQSVSEADATVTLVWTDNKKTSTIAVYGEYINRHRMVVIN
jgi:hypothetical protein